MSRRNLIEYTCDCCKKETVLIAAEGRLPPERWALVEVKVHTFVHYVSLCPNCAPLHLVAIGVNSEMWRRAVDSIPDNRV